MDPKPDNEQRRLAIQMLGGCFLVVLLAALATWLYLFLYGRTAERNEKRLQDQTPEQIDGQEAK